MQIELRDPKKIMKLSRLGSFHQSKLSFLRSFLREFKDWDYKRDMFDLDENGHGVAVYSFKKKTRNYSLICFSNKIDDHEDQIELLLLNGMQALRSLMVCLLKKILID